MLRVGELAEQGMLIVSNRPRNALRLKGLVSTGLARDRGRRWNCDRLAVNDEAARPNRGDRRACGGKPVREVSAAAAEQLDLLAPAGSDDAVAVVLYFMHPAGAGRRLVGGTRQAGFDEAGETAVGRTQRHGAEMIARSFSNFDCLGRS